MSAGAGESWAKDAALIGEGHCPRCEKRLDEMGRCAPCRVGWALRPATEDELWMGSPVIVETFLRIGDSGDAATAESAPIGPERTAS